MGYDSHATSPMGLKTPPMLNRTSNVYTSQPHDLKMQLLLRITIWHDYGNQTSNELRMDLPVVKTPSQPSKFGTPFSFPFTSSFTTVLLVHVFPAAQGLDCLLIHMPCSQNHRNARSVPSTVSSAPYINSEASTNCLNYL